MPQSLGLSGYPGNFEVNLKNGLKSSQVKAGAIILDLATTGKNKPAVFNEVFKDSFLGRMLTWKGYPTSKSLDTRDYCFKMTSGIFIIPSNMAIKPEKQAEIGVLVAAHVSTYCNQGQISPRKCAVTINEKLCRGCGDCISLCPYIEMRKDVAGQNHAYIHPALCYGCGACIASCPTGAITQPFQSETSMTSALEALLGKVK
jgi:ferredoxin